jgi:hypothetical protein
MPSKKEKVPNGHQSDERRSAHALWRSLPAWCRHMVTPIGLWSPTLGIGAGGPTDRELLTLMKICDGRFSISQTMVGRVSRNFGLLMSILLIACSGSRASLAQSGQYFRQCGTGKRGGTGLQRGDVGREILEFASRHDLGHQILSRSNKSVGLCRTPLFSRRADVGIGHTGKGTGSGARMADRGFLYIR